MQLMKIEELKPHPRNSEFFDDMTGEKWQEFLKSIKTSGVIEPIVITQDKVIVSGHQRVRACKELGITEIMTEMRSYDSEDKIIKDLLETNVRQRGNIGGSSVKLGRRIRELERIYGIQQGNNQHQEDSNNVGKLTQEDLLKQLGLNKETYRQAKSLTTLPIEIQDLIEQGNISPSTASRLIAKLTPEQQEELVSALPVTEKLTQRQVSDYVDRINVYKIEAEEAKNLKDRIRVLQDSIDEMKNKVPDEKVIEVEPSDYKDLQRHNKDLQRINDFMNREYQKRCNEVGELRSRLSAMEEDMQKHKAERELKSNCDLFCARCDDFMVKVGGYAYLSDKLDMLPKRERDAYLRCVQMISAWALNIIGNIENKMNVNGDDFVYGN